MPEVRLSKDVDYITMINYFSVLSKMREDFVNAIAI